MESKNLRALLRDEMKDLQGPEIKRFRLELAKRLPETVKKAAEAAKMAPEMARVETTEQNQAKKPANR